MESLSSEAKGLALDVLYDIQSAIDRLEERTVSIHDVDDFLDTPRQYRYGDAARRDRLQGLSGRYLYHQAISCSTDAS